MTINENIENKNVDLENRGDMLIESIYCTIEIKDMEFLNFLCLFSLEICY